MGNSIDSDDEKEYIQQEEHYPTTLFQDVLHILLSQTKTQEEEENRKSNNNNGSILLKSYRPISNNSVDNDNNYPIINENFIKDLLLSYNEIDAASNTKLINDMISIATNTKTTKKQKEIRLNESTFINILTNDLLTTKEDSFMDENNNKKKTTSFYDVFGMELRDINFLDFNNKVIKIRLLLK